MTNYTKVKICYQYTPESFVKIGAGYGKNSYVDNAQRHSVTNKGKQHYEIPGTSVKGRIRANLEQVEYLLPQKVVTNIFGESGHEGWAHFSSLVPQKKVKVGITTSTAVDRFRKSAKNGALRVEEYAQIEQQGAYEGHIEGHINGALQTKEIYSLLLALLRTTYFGGDKSTGFGKGSITIKEVVIGEGSLDLTTLPETILKNLSE